MSTSSPARIERSASSDSIASQATSGFGLWDEVTGPTLTEALSAASSMETDMDQPTYRRKDPGSPGIDWTLQDEAIDVSETTHETETQLSAMGQKRKLDDELTSSAGPSKVQRREFEPSSFHVEDTCRNPVVISDPGVHRHLVHQASFGVQWELVRYQNSPLGWRPSDIASDQEIRALSEATNVDGVEKLTALVEKKKGSASDKMSFESAFARERAAKDPWAESDWEHDIMCSAEAQGSPSYLHDLETQRTGGKVHYCIKLVSLAEGKEEFHVERACLGTSNQLTRRYGSHSFVRIHMEKHLTRRGKVLARLFLRPFIIGGHVFRAFHSKERIVFLVMTNEVAVDILQPAPPQSPRYEIHASAGGSSWRSGVDYLKFIDSHNDLRLNPGQAMAKWSARFALGLSTSVAGARIHPTCLHYIPDIVSAAYHGKGKVPSELIMTDGCGLANYDFFHELQLQFRCETVPTAVQIRLNGAKGLLIKHPSPDHPYTSSESRPEVWLRDSQRKIKYPADNTHPALYTVDVLRIAHLSYPASLSTETIINLAENGVPLDVFKSLMKTSMQEKIDGLTTWSGPDGIYQLYYNLAKEGGVVAARLARGNPAFARAMGWIFDDVAPDDVYNDGEGDTEDEALDKATSESSSAWWPDPVGGSPSSLEETCMELIDSGFSPDHLPVLREKLKKVAEKANKTTLEKYRMQVPMSCSAWAVPDPLGILEAGEIYVESSRPLLCSDGKTMANVITGDVLITRHPCKVPSDVQKVVAVYRRELSGYKDVVVVSTKGHRVGDRLLHRHLLSMLGGGDYDGDRVQVYWHPDLVSGFRHADPNFATPPEAVNQCLEKNVESVESFLERVPDTAPWEYRIAELQRVLLVSLRNASIVGTCSNWWEKAVYKYGYDSNEAVRLAYLFCAVLDGSKTGVAVKREQWDKDSKAYESDCGPYYKTSGDHTSRVANYSNLPPTRRNKMLPPFVMDKLRAFLDKLKRQLDVEIEKRLGERRLIVPDPHLVLPWNDLRERARELALKQEQDWMEKLVAEIMKGVQAKRRECKALIGKDFTSMAIEKRQDVLRKCSQSFHSLLLDLRNRGFIQYAPEDLLRYIASYAYIHDHEANHRWSRFPWDVAFRTLCEIKAKAVGVTKTVLADFYIRLMIHKKWL